MPHAIGPEQLETLLVEHGAALRLFAAQWTAAPEDAVQEAFLDLVKQPMAPRNVVAWLYAVVRNRAISDSRSAQRRRQHEFLASQSETNWLLPTQETSADAATVTDALRSVDEQYREVIVARIWGDLSLKEIGDVIGISTSSVHRRYEAGLQQLRERLAGAWINSTESSTNSTKSSSC